MKALLPFIWQRLSPAAQQELAAARTDFLCHAFLRPEVVQSTGPKVLPDFLVFTSVNGLHSALVQEWFETDWRKLPAYVIGSKTGKMVQEAGFEVKACLGPPATDLLAQLPNRSRQGLWLSGEDSAHDLPALAPAHNLERQIVYRMQRDAESYQALKQDLARYEIRSLYITSVRVALEFSALLPSSGNKSDAAPQLALALSGRLAAVAKASWPGIKLRVVPHLESGVCALKNDLYAQK